MLGRLFDTKSLSNSINLQAVCGITTPRVQGAVSGGIVYLRPEALHLSPYQGADWPSRIGPEQSRGSVPVDTVVVLDWDRSHRFPEAFFAIP